MGNVFSRAWKKLARREAEDVKEEIDLVEDGDRSLREPDIEAVIEKEEIAARYRPALDAAARKQFADWYDASRPFISEVAGRAAEQGVYAQGLDLPLAETSSNIENAAGVVPVLIVDLDGVVTRQGANLMYMGLFTDNKNERISLGDVGERYGYFEPLDKPFRDHARAEKELVEKALVEIDGRKILDLRRISDEDMARPRRRIVDGLLECFDGWRKDAAIRYHEIQLRTVYDQLSHPEHSALKDSTPREVKQVEIMGYRRVVFSTTSDGGVAACLVKLNNMLLGREFVHVRGTMPVFDQKGRMTDIMLNSAEEKVRNMKKLLSSNVEWSLDSSFTMQRPAADYFRDDVVSGMGLFSLKPLDDADIVSNIGMNVLVPEAEQDDFVKSFVEAVVVSDNISDTFAATSTAGQLKEIDARGSSVDFYFVRPPADEVKGPPGVTAHALTDLGELVSVCRLRQELLFDLYSLGAQGIGTGFQLVNENAAGAIRNAEQRLGDIDSTDLSDEVKNRKKRKESLKLRTLLEAELEKFVAGHKYAVDSVLAQKLKRETAKIADDGTTGMVGAELASSAYAVMTQENVRGLASALGQLGLSRPMKDVADLGSPAASRADYSFLAPKARFNERALAVAVAGVLRDYGKYEEFVGPPASEFFKPVFLEFQSVFNDLWLELVS